MAALASAFRGISAELQATLESSNVNPHGVTKGTIRETRLRDALRSHIPSRFDLELGGLVMNVRGSTSTAQDIVITDGLAAPPFMFGNSIHPIEAVSGVVEVKTGSSKKDIVEGVEQIASVKRLLDGRLWRSTELDRERGGAPPPSPFGALFCYRLGRSAGLVVGDFVNACMKLSPEEWPDTFCVLGKFSTQWRKDQNMVPFSNATPHGAESIIRYDTQDAALFFYMHLLERLGRYQPPPLELMYYLNHGGASDHEPIDVPLPEQKHGSRS